MNDRYNRDSKCGQCEYCNNKAYPDMCVCYETEEHRGVAITVKENQQACRQFRGKR